MEFRKKIKLLSLKSLRRRRLKDTERGGLDLPDVLAGGLMQGDESSVGTRYGAFDEDEFLIGKDFGDLQTLGGNFFVAVLSVHLLALEDPARGRTLSDAPGSTMPAVTVRSGLSMESVAFHDSGKAFPL